jgi:hypothetical protein
MCKSCVQPVHTVLEGPAAVHILCAAFLASRAPTVRNRQLYQNSPHRLTPYFSTHILTISHLLQSQLYPLSTVPIIRAIN